MACAVLWLCSGSPSRIPQRAIFVLWKVNQNSLDKEMWLQWPRGGNGHDLLYSCVHISLGTSENIWHPFAYAVNCGGVWLTTQQTCKYLSGGFHERFQSSPISISEINTLRLILFSNQCFRSEYSTINGYSPSFDI